MYKGILWLTNSALGCSQKQPFEVSIFSVDTSLGHITLAIIFPPQEQSPQTSNVSIGIQLRKPGITIQYVFRSEQGPYRWCGKPFGLREVLRPHNHHAASLFQSPQSNRMLSIQSSRCHVRQRLQRIINFNPSTRARRSSHRSAHDHVPLHQQVRSWKSPSLTGVSHPHGKHTRLLHRGQVRH